VIGAIFFSSRLELWVQARNNPNLLSRRGRETRDLMATITATNN